MSLKKIHSEAQRAKVTRSDWEGLRLPGPVPNTQTLGAQKPAALRLLGLLAALTSSGSTSKHVCVGSPWQVGHNMAAQPHLQLSQARARGLRLPTEVCKLQGFAQWRKGSAPLPLCPKPSQPWSAGKEESRSRAQNGPHREKMCHGKYFLMLVCTLDPAVRHTYPVSQSLGSRPSSAPISASC